jgi:isopentenyl-diphosphate delta-isomerase
MADQHKDISLTSRKQDHIDLAFQAQMANHGPDPRFYYEPLLSGHPDPDADISIAILGKTLKAPLWVSSMTGGTEKAYTINRRLAETCAKFGLGMGLGSCRALLQNHDRLPDFDLRSIIGPDLPFYANLGIAQIEELIQHNQLDRITDLIERLHADGLIIHVNPLQEWLQPEGDAIHTPPIEIIKTVLTYITSPVIVKEVGQGMGPESLAALLKLPIAALELAAHGGTNFSRLELLRSDPERRESFDTISTLGHTASEMIAWINQLSEDNIKCRQFIVSGGIRDFLDGYYLTRKLKWPSVYGQASGFLKHALESQEALDAYVSQQIRGLQLAQAYLRVR